MGELFPVDLTSLLKKAIEADKRPPDGKLHASSDLVGSLRHTQLRAIGAPTRPERIASGLRNMTGTLWHKYVENLLRENGVEVETEVKLDEWLPSGWSGTADYIFFHPGYEAYVLGDLKTVKAENMFFVGRDGAKTEHIWQLSMYFHALVEKGLPMLDAVGVVYVPFFDTHISSPSPEPILQEVAPLPGEVVLERAELRSTEVANLRAYIALEGYSFDSNGQLEEFRVPGWEENTKLLEWLTLPEGLAPEQERLQKKVWDGKKSVFNVVLTPHWSAAYCDWDEPLCNCRNQGQTKIGEYNLDGEYTPRKGYENIEPVVSPTRKELNERRRAES